MKAHALTSSAPEKDSMTYIDRRKKPGLAGRKPSQPQLHFRFEANLDYIRPSEKSLRERITDNDFRLNIHKMFSKNSCN